MTHLEKLKTATSRIDAVHLLQLIGLAAWMTVCLLSASFFARYMAVTTLRIMCLLPFVLAEVIRLTADTYDRRETFGFAVALFMLFVAFNAGMDPMFDAIFIIFCLRNADFREMAKLCLVIMLTTLVITVASAFLNVIPNAVAGQGVSGARVRWHLGYLGPLFPAQIAFSITCLSVYLRGKKLGAAETVLLLVLNIFIYSFTDSRLSFILSLAVLVIAHMLRAGGSLGFKSAFISGALSCSYIIFAILAIALAVAYTPNVGILQSINDAFGGRLLFAHNGIGENGVPLFGQEVELRGWGLQEDGEVSEDVLYKGVNYIDSSYILLLVRYGWPFMVVFLCSMTCVCLRGARDNQHLLLIIMAIIAAHCLIDDLALYLYYNPFLLLFGSLAARQTEEPLFNAPLQWSHVATESSQRGLFVSRINTSNTLFDSKRNDGLLTSCVNRGGRDCEESV